MSLDNMNWFSFVENRVMDTYSSQNGEFRLGELGEQFEDHLAEFDGPVTIQGIDYSPGALLRAYAPADWENGFNDWIGSEYDAGRITDQLPVLIADSWQGHRNQVIAGATIVGLELPEDEDDFDEWNWLADELESDHGFYWEDGILWRNPQK